MAESNRSPQDKTNLHSRNRHRQRYDFPALVRACPELQQYVFQNPYGDLSVSFSDPAAVKVLNKALLKHTYGVAVWDLPDGYLCPPIPGRADYVHYAADLLAGDSEAVTPHGNRVRVLDIGVGANCIYPLIGVKEYGWKFTGSDIDPAAVKWAQKMVDANGLSGQISIRKQASARQIFMGVWHREEVFDLTICNPPFYSSAAEAASSSARKWSKLDRGKDTGTRNFGGTRSELWCEGGEVRFLRQMITESSLYKDRCLWFTSLVSSKDTLYHCNRAFEQVQPASVRTIGMSQGQKKSRMLAWSFLSPSEMDEWKERRWKSR